MTVDIEIKSNDDDSVTLRVGSITAHITGDGWCDANRAAHVLAAHVAGTYELSALRLRLSGMRSVVADVERSLRATEHHMTELAAYVEPCSTPARNDPDAQR